MPQASHVTSEDHARQIEAYAKERPRYEAYADVLLRTLRSACTASIPQAFVQARAKTLSSFAEKCARKCAEYSDAVHDLTDLCGARVIVQTLEQVEAVKLFIERSFEIHERDEKGTSLAEDEFAYRDMRYVIGLIPGRCAALGITSEEQQTIASKRAEIQVRTWLQHAWANTFHDLVSKNPLELPMSVKRTGALLAALMEDADQHYSRMVHDLDGVIANCSAVTKRVDVEKEIRVQGLMLANEPLPDRQPALALELARLLTACGRFKEVVQTLDPYCDVQGANRAELLQELGHALCKVHRGERSCDEYGRGMTLLHESLAALGDMSPPFVPHLRRRESVLGQVYARLAWALSGPKTQLPVARDHWQQAHECEPENPYYLASMVGFEIQCAKSLELPAAMRTVLGVALKTCLDHATASAELPYAYFTAGRLSLLLDQPLTALGYYARGSRHVLLGEYCCPPDVLQTEREWLAHLHCGSVAPPKIRWIEDLLELVQKVASLPPVDRPMLPKAAIVAGGAASVAGNVVERMVPLLELVLQDFEGTVIGGGTTSGVPGCVGSVAGGLARENRKRFDLIGYIPKELPYGALKDEQYDRLIGCEGNRFSPELILQCWRDLLTDTRPEQVLCLGFGGGPLSAVEYHVALALGAAVILAHSSEGAADALINDPLWSGVPNLLPLPMDVATFQALLSQPHEELAQSEVPEMAKAFHNRYLAGSAHRFPPNMRPWEQLETTYQEASVEQARYTVNILRAAGFGVRKRENPAIFQGFDKKDVERMAEMEHGRWNFERLRAGWRPGATRDNNAMIHDCIVPWEDLLKRSDNIAKYDRDAVRAFPRILAEAGLEIFKQLDSPGENSCGSLR